MLPSELWSENLVTVHDPPFWWLKTGLPLPEFCFVLSKPSRTLVGYISSLLLLPLYGFLAPAALGSCHPYWYQGFQFNGNISKLHPQPIGDIHYSIFKVRCPLIYVLFLCVCAWKKCRSLSNSGGRIRRWVHTHMINLHQLYYLYVFAFIF